MKKNNLKRFLASLLAVLMLSQVTGVAPGVFADFGESSRSGIATYAKYEIVLNGDCSVRLPYKDNGDIDYDALKQVLFNQCVNVSASTPNTLTVDDVDITAGILPLTTIKEDKTYEITFRYKTIYTKSCKVTFLGRQAVPEIADKDITVDASFNEDLSIDYNALRKAIWEQVSVSLPENVKFDKVSFEYKYNDTLNLWGAFEGKNIIPSLDLGTNKVKLTWGGDNEYKAWEQEITVDVVDGRTDTSITFVNYPTVIIPYEKNAAIDAAKLTENIWDIVDTITPNDISKDKITVLFDGKALDEANITEGSHTLTFKYAGTQTYKSFSTDVTVNFIDNRIEAFSAKEQPENISAGFVKNDANAELTVKNIREALVNKLSDLDLSEVSVECTSSIDVTGAFYSQLSDDGLNALLTTGTKANIKLTYAGSESYKPFTSEFKGIKFADNRVASSIAIKEGASITFNMSADNIKQQIFDNVIDWDSENTKLPAKDTLSIDDFKFEVGSKDIADKDGYPNLDAGNGQTIKISFVGNSEFKPCKDVEATIDVAKADVKVTMKSFSTAHAGKDDELTQEKLGVALDPNDPKLDVYMIFAGINTNLDTSLNLVLTKEQQAVINNISEFQKNLYNIAPDLFKDQTTLKEKLEKGITIKEFKEYINSFVDILEKATQMPVFGDKINDLIEKYGVSIDTLKTMATIFDKLTQFSADTVIAVGIPKHAGLYTATAVAVNKNYNTGVASGTVMILMNVKDMKIQLNSNFSKKMTVEEAKALAEDPAGVATLLCGTKPVSNPNLHYLYTGVQSNLKPYSSTTTFPTEPGRYVVTIVTLGGDYLAAPVTKTFQITK